MTDQEGQSFSGKKIWTEKFVSLTFFFTSCPDICPKMAVSMADLQDEFINDSDVLLISHSV
ncbi:MAG: SCO family protein, partial [Saprospiraceae bacterium]|nr:SCO family protein [Saprospiraceae bacterium]